MTAELKLSDILSDDDFHAGVARLLIIARQSDTILQAMTYLPHEYPRKHEDRVFLMGLFLASLKELVDALNFLDSRGFLAKICSDTNPLPDLRDDAKQAMAFLDKDNPSSLYSRLLTRVRNNAGFHVNLKELRAALFRCKDTTVVPVVTTGEERKVETIPVIPYLMAEISYAEGCDLRADLAEASRLHSAASRVALDLYLIGVRIAESKQEAQPPGGH